MLDFRTTVSYIIGEDAVPVTNARHTHRVTLSAGGGKGL
jgi:hypothetical protein